MKLSKRTSIDRGSLLFSLFLLALFCAFFSASLSLDPRDRLVPMMVLTLAIALGVFCVLGEIFPDLARMASGSLSKLDVPVRSEEAPAVVEAGLFYQNGTWVTTLWLAGFSVLILFVGFRVAIPIAMLVFLRPLANQGWVKSIVVTLVIWGLSYGFFDLVMGFHLFNGILFGEMLLF